MVMANNNRNNRRPVNRTGYDVDPMMRGEPTRQPTPPLSLPLDVAQTTPPASPLQQETWNRGPLDPYNIIEGVSPAWNPPRPYAVRYYPQQPFHGTGPDVDPMLRGQQNVGPSIAGRHSTAVSGDDLRDRFMMAEMEKRRAREQEMLRQNQMMMQMRNQQPGPPPSNLRGVPSGTMPPGRFQRLPIIMPNRPEDQMRIPTHIQLLAGGPAPFTPPAIGVGGPAPFTTLATGVGSAPLNIPLGHDIETPQVPVPTPPLDPRIPKQWKDEVRKQQEQRPITKIEYQTQYGHDPKPEWFRDAEFAMSPTNKYWKFPWDSVFNRIMMKPMERYTSEEQKAIQNAIDDGYVFPYGSTGIDPIAARFGGPEFGMDPMEREEAIIDPKGKPTFDPSRGIGEFKGAMTWGDLSDPEVRARVIAELEKANLPIDSQKVINYLTENENQLDEREGLTDTEKRVNDLMTTLNAGTGGQGGDLGLNVTQLFELTYGYADAVKKAMGQWTVADAQRVGDDRDPEAVNGTLSLDFVRQLPVPPEVLGQFTINLSNLVTQFLEQEYRRTLLEPEERLVYERRAEQFDRDLRKLDDELKQAGFDRRQTELQRQEQIRQANLEADLRREQMQASQQTAMFQAALQNPFAFAAFQQMQGGVNPFQAALANLGFQVPGAQMPPVPGLPPAAMPAPMPTPAFAPTGPILPPGDYRGPGTGFDIDPMERGEIGGVGGLPGPMVTPTGPTQLLPGTGFDVDPMERGVIPPVGIVPSPPPTGPTQLLPGTGFDVDPVIRGDQPFVAPLLPPTLGPTPGTVYGTGPDVPPMLRGEPVAPYVAPTPQQTFAPQPPTPGPVYGTGFDVDPMMRGELIQPLSLPTPQQRPQGTLLSMPQFGRMPTYGQAAGFFPEVGLPTIGALRQIDPESIEYLNAMLGYGGVSPRQFAQQVAAITPQVTRPITSGFGRAATRLGMGR